MDASTGRVMSMRCQDIHLELAAYLDGRIAVADGRAFRTHLEGCQECSIRLEQLSKTRSVLQRLPSRTVPPELTDALRSLAFRESVRQRSRRHWKLALSDWMDSARIRLENLMRPLALPAAGGVLSAVLLFGSLVPAFTRSPRVAQDVPTAFYTQASLDEGSPLVFHDDLVVDLTIDQEGRLMDFALPYEPALARNAAIRHAIASNLLFTRFTPATAFGQPTSGKIRITLVNVKG